MTAGPAAPFGRGGGAGKSSTPVGKCASVGVLDPVRACELPDPPQAESGVSDRVKRGDGGMKGDEPPLDCCLFCCVQANGFGLYVAGNIRSSAASRAEDPKDELERPPNPKLLPPNDDEDDAPPKPKPDGAFEPKGDESADMSSRSSSEGIEIVGLTVLMAEPEGRLMTVCAAG